MRIMKIFSGTLIPILLILQGCGGSIATFDTAAFERDLDKMTKKYLTVDGEKRLDKVIVKRVVIPEFNVEYIVNFDRDSYYRDLTDAAYSVFVENLESIAGVEVVAKDAVATSPVYQVLNKDMEPFTGGQSYSRKYTSTTYIVPVTGLGNLNPMKKKGKGLLSGIKAGLGNVGKEPGLLDDLDADATIKVHLLAYKAGKKEDVHAFLPHSVKGVPSTTNVQYGLGVSKTPAATTLGFGYTDADGNKWMVQYKGNVGMGLYEKSNLVAAQTCAKTKKSLDYDRYKKGYLDMVDVYSKMVATKLKESQK